MDDPVWHGGRSSAFAGRIEHVFISVSDDASLTSRRSTRHSSRARLLVVAVIVALAYVGLLVLYAISGQTRGVDVGDSPPAGGVRIDLSPEAVDGAAQRFTVGLDLTPSAELLDESQLTLVRPITVVLDPSAGSREVTFPAGQIPAVNHIEVLLDGDIRNWPLDHYAIPLIVGAYEGSPEDGSAVDSIVAMEGRVQGWRISVDPDDNPPGFGFHTFNVDIRRSGDTLVFAAIMLLVLITLPLVAWFVAGRTYWGGRPLQLTVLSWMGAMLFATVPLRNFLPGSPPAGAWIDAVIVLWVIVALVGALVVYVMAWARQDKPLL